MNRLMLRSMSDLAVEFGGHPRPDQVDSGVLRIDLYENRYTWEFLPIDKSKELPLTADCTTRK